MALRSSSGDIEASISLLETSPVIGRSCSCSGSGGEIVSDGVCATIARSDAHRLLDVHDEDLSVADPAGAGGFGDSLDDIVDQAVLHDDLDLHLGEKVDDIFGTPIELRMPLLAAEALHLGDGDSGNARIVQRVLHVVELERLDDRFDFFHRASAAAS